MPPEFWVATHESEEARMSEQAHTDRRPILQEKVLSLGQLRLNQRQAVLDGHAVGVGQLLNHLRVSALGGQGERLVTAQEETFFATELQPGPSFFPVAVLIATEV